MRRVAVVGVGHSKFGRRDDVNLGELAFESIKPALEDAGLAPEDIPFLVVGNGGFSEETLPAVAIADYSELYNAEMLRVEAACASASAALATAYHAVASGKVDVAMAVGCEKMTELDTPYIVELIGRAGFFFWEFQHFGLTFPGYYALHATAYMNQYGATEEHLAMVAVKNHKYAATNPYAQFRQEITVEQVLRSPYIAWPLKLFDCCPITDGSATVIVAAEEKAKKLTDTPIWIEAIEACGGSANLSKRENFVGLKAAQVAAEKAFKKAKITPDKIDVASVHDCFTIAELMAMEDIGFCKRGEAYKFVEEGQTYIGGKIPINVDGGLKAKGHPIGATGTSMVYSLTKQLRGEYIKSNQVPIKHGYALAHNVGGTGHYAYVTILSRK
ncbi:MAG: thiolase domain-containing protein [Candidatus Freyarchaeota archaeon]|nr:thiolase domain-containing protein [Candidatus Jordarchaeia archaeon]